MRQLTPRTRPASRARRLLWLPVVAALGWTGCEAGDAAGPVASGPPAGEVLVFQREGVPGPWWKSGATQETFDAEHRVCLVRSREARANATGGDPADAAYRAFLECMMQHSWSRGLPPRS